MDNQNYSSKYYFKIYICLVTVILMIIYLPILFMGKTYIYIDIAADTYCSYWPSISYVKHLIRDFKLWDISLGWGASTASYISYFLIDPFNWICFLFEDQKIYIGIFIGLIMKNIVLAIFSYKLIGLKKIEGFSRVFSALIIVFSGWMIGWGQHYNFATVYVVFVVCFYFLEKWIQQGKFLGLIFSIAYLLAFAPYFCYMSGIVLGIYFLFSVFSNKCTFRDNIVDVFKTIAIVVLAFGLALPLFVANAEAILACPRVSGKLIPSLKLAEVEQYRNMLLRSVSNNILGINDFFGRTNYFEDPFLYIGIVSLILLVVYCFLEISKKRNIIAILMFTGCFVFLNFSTPLFNAFSAETYRWTGLFVPFAAIACGRALSEINNMRWIICALSVILLAVIFWNYIKDRDIILKDNIKSLSYCFVFIVLITICLVACLFKKNILIPLLFVTVIDFAFNGYVSVNMRSNIYESDVSQFNYFDGTKDTVEQIRNIDDGYFRIEKTYAGIDLDDFMFQHYYGEKLYNSTLSKYTWNMLELFNLRGKGSNYLYGLDDKQTLRNITCGKYRFSKTDTNYYGYKKIMNNDGIFVYSNCFSSPFGVVYYNSISENEFKKYTSFQKQILLLDACVLEDDVEPINDEFEAEFDDSIYGEILFQGLLSDSVISKPQINSPTVLRFTTSGCAGVVHLLDENGCAIQDVSFQMTGEDEIYIDNNQYFYISIDLQYGAIDYITLFEVDSSIIEKKYEMINEEHLNVTYFDDMEIKGQIDMKSSGVVFVPLAYTDGWRIEVNDKKIEPYVCNGGFFAIPLDSGENLIHIYYSSKYIKVSIYINIFAICILGGIIIKNIYERKGEYGKQNIKKVQ